MENVMHNVRAVDFVRKIFGIVSGMVAGVLGLTGSQGFAMYVFRYLFVSVMLLARMNFNLKRHFQMTPIAFAINGIGGQVLTFVLFWSLGFALVHIY